MTQFRSTPPNSSLNQVIFGINLALLVIIASALFIVILTSFTFHSNRDSQLLELLTSCPYRAWTGHPCPLCGVTTAAAHLLLGQFRTSLTINPLAATLTLPALSQLIYRTLRVVRPRFSFREELSVDLGGLVAAVTIGTLVYFS